MEVDVYRLMRDLEELSAEQLAGLPTEVLDAMSRALRYAHGNLAAEPRRRGEQRGNGFNPQMPTE